MAHSKTCNRCGETRDVSEFPRNARSPDGLYSLCKPCRKRAQDAYRAHPVVREREQKRQAMRYAENKTVILAALREHRKHNLDDRRRQTAAWRQNNLERHRAMCRKWAREHPEAMRAIVAKRRARKANAAGSYTHHDIRLLFAAQQGKCPCCPADLAEAGYHVDHIMPLALGGSNEPDNLQLLCPTCNRRKGRKHPDEWKREVHSRRAGLAANREHERCA